MLKQWLAGSVRSSQARTRGSQVFSVEDDLSELDRQVKQNLEQHFRPVFQRFVYGGERIASHDLRRLLQDENYRDLLPPDKVYELIDLVDFNPGKAISYTEFVRIVTGGFETELPGALEEKNIHGTDTPKTWLNWVCRNTVPQAEVDDYLTTYRWIPPPFFMISISIAQLIVFIYYAVDLAYLTNQEAQVEALDVVPAYSPLMYLQTKRHEPWRFITYMLLHQGVIDLVFNLCLQVIIGFPLEIMFSWWRLAIVYIVGVITGSLAQSVCDHYVGLAGAAGGAYAVVIAHVVALITNYTELDSKKNVEKRAKHWWGRPLFRLVLIFVVLLVQIALAVFRRFNPGYPAFKVGIAAHGGGIVAGVLLGRPFMTDNLRYPWQQNAGWLDMFILLAFFGVCVVVNIVYDGYPDAE